VILENPKGSDAGHRSKSKAYLEEFVKNISIELPQ
jgi:hypothetical protein